MDINLRQIINNPINIRKIGKYPHELQNCNQIYEYYLINLKSIVANSLATIDFKNINEFHIDESLIKFRFDIPDRFVNENALRSFAMELEQHGTYWPFIVSGNKLSEGIHRAYCLQMINSNKKWMVVSFQKHSMDQLLPELTPLYIIFPDQIYFETPAIQNNLKFVESNIYKAVAVTYGDIYEFMVLFSKYFSEIVINYRELFIPNKIINNQESFILWKESK